MRLSLDAHGLRVGDVLEIAHPGTRTISLRGLGERDADLLEMWCGPHRPRSSSLTSMAQQLGHDAARFRQAVEHLRLTGLTAAETTVTGCDLSAPPGERRESVGIVGLGPLGLLIAQGLLSAGVADLQLDDPRPILTQDVGIGGYRLADVGGKRASVAAALLRDRTNSTIVSDRGLEEPAVVVVTSAARDLTGTAHLVCSGIPHLLVTANPSVTEVGPLVHPGTSACINCLGLHQQSEATSASAGRGAPRVDDSGQAIDLPAQLSAGLIESGFAAESATIPAETTSLRAASDLAAAALAVAIIVHELAARRSGHLARTSRVAITTLRTGPAGIGFEHSAWKPHPDCGCLESAGIWSDSGRQA